MAKLTDKTMVEVFNNSTGSVSYYSELNRAKRRWDLPGSVKKVSLEELKDLVNEAGGFKLLEQSILLIKDNDVRQELNLSIEKEYVMGDSEIIKALINNSADEIEEIMDKAPETINEKIAAKAIEAEVSDLKKLNVIKEKSGVNVLAAIQEKEEDKKQKDKKK